jgi:CDGSH-type Zn-finger protein/ferredoxin
MAVKITLLTDGPIALEAAGEDLPVLQCQEGDDIRAKETVFLCRCGESRNKPFCDGTHVASGYTDKNVCTNDRLENFEATGITVHFNRSICSGAAECVRNLPAVFESKSEDWIHPAAASVEEVVETVRKCPSGALTFTIGGETAVKQEKAVSIRIVKNGPYEIKGPVEMDTPRWSVNASQTNFTLCRCGRSRNIPFCDYSHGEQGWDDTNEAGE